MYMCVHNVCVEGVIASSPQDEEYARQLQCEQGVLASDSDVSLSDQEDSTDIVSGYHDVQ